MTVHVTMLIELVVVLAIIGILLALAVPRYLGARKKAYGATSPTNRIRAP
jgi:type II secretory pathway pseudopilin PulG